jgi:hypothetical protein
MLATGGVGEEVKIFPDIQKKQSQKIFSGLTSVVKVQKIFFSDKSSSFKLRW